MKYDALTIDTNIIKKNGYKFLNGILGQLSQFSGSPFQFVLSEIVVNETKNHVILYNKSLVEKFISTVNKIGSRSFVDAADSKTLDIIIGKIKPPEEVAEMQLEEFFKLTQTEVVPVLGVDIETLTRLYFEVQPPFEGAGSKKHEFPDAIALISLDQWAQENNKRLLAISDDGGWKSYAEGSDHIAVETDLAKALGEFQQHTDKATALLERFLSQLETKEFVDVKQYIHEEIGGQLDLIDITPETSSHLSFDAELESVSLNEFSFTKAGNSYCYDIVRIDDDEVVVKLKVDLDVSADSVFSFYVFDSIDKDYVPLGSTLARVHTILEAAVLVTLQPAHEVDGSEFDVEIVELLSVNDSLYFDDVEPDFDYEE